MKLINRFDYSNLLFPLLTLLITHICHLNWKIKKQERSGNPPDLIILSETVS